MTQANHVHDLQLGALPLTIRPLTLDDRGYARATMREGVRKSSALLCRLPWPAYKHTTQYRRIDEIIDSADLLGSFTTDNRIAGWIAYTPGRAVSTVHWCYTRVKLGETPARRRGVMAGLIDHAQLGKRIAYTHRGVRQVLHHHRYDRAPDAPRAVAKGPTLDLAIVDWLRGRGVTATFVDLEEWLR